MIYLIYLAVIICMLAMFKVSRGYKIAIILLSESIFFLVKVPYIPYGAANYVIPVAFIVSEFPNLKRLLNSAKGKLVWKLMLLAPLTIFIALIFSPNLQDFTVSRGYFRREILFKYFLLIYAYWCYSDENSLKPTLKITTYAMIFITIMGILNLITMKAGWVEIVMSGRDIAGGKSAEEFATMFMHDERFRNQSVFQFAFDYGFFCIAILLLHLYAYTRKLENAKTFVFVALCCLFGIFTCGCRTVVLCAIISLLCYYIMANNLKKIINIAIISIPLLIISYEFIPQVNKQVNAMFTMFEADESLGGSSINGRLLQYTAVAYHIKDDWLFGRGVFYFAIDLNGRGAVSERVDKDLQGMEGVTSLYLLERGIIGYALYMSFWIWVYFYIRKRRKVAPRLAAFGCTLIISYIAFANMTGELNSLLYVLPLLGYILKTLDIYNLQNKQNGRISNNCKLQHQTTDR